MRVMVMMMMMIFDDDDDDIWRQWCWYLIIMNIFDDIKTTVTIRSLFFFSICFLWRMQNTFSLFFVWVSWRGDSERVEMVTWGDSKSVAFTIHSFSLSFDSGECKNRFILFYISCLGGARVRSQRLWCDSECDNDW